MTYRITYSVLDANMDELHRDFEAALVSARARLGGVFPSWVDGKAVTSGDLLASINPADTRETLATFHRARTESVDAAVLGAKRAQRAWAARPWQERVAILRKAAEIISERRLLLAAVMTLEVGKTRLESLGDIEESADLLRYYAGCVEEANGFLKPLARLAPREDTRSVLRPYGVFAVVAPFNFPSALAAGMAGAALVAGNAVVLKPSEQTPYCAQGLYEAFRDAGLPDGLLQVLHGEGETVGRTLVAHPSIDGVAFTGSAAVGMQLHATMSTGRVRPCLLELGGKNAAIVCDDADLEAAATGCVRSAFGLSGQKCSALSRIYVQRSKLDAFTELLVAKTRALVVTLPEERAASLGPVIDRRAVKRFERAVAEANESGRILAGGARPTAKELTHGHFVMPTIAQVPRGHRLTRDELFLPFVTVDTFTTLDEAITEVNRADYGLTAGIFSRDTAKVEAFLERAEAGVLYTNRAAGATTGAWPGVQSFCGWKGSGSTGKGGCGPYYVSQFAREQSQTRCLDIEIPSTDMPSKEHS